MIFLPERITSDASCAVLMPLTIFCFAQKVLGIWIIEQELSWKQSLSDGLVNDLQG